jgi:MFS family permease
MGQHLAEPADARPTFRSSLRHRDFRLLLGAHGVGTIAQLVLTLAVGIEVLHRTTSSVWVSVTVALGFAPYVLFSGYAGLIADRWSRSVVLTWSFGCRTGCAMLLTMGLWLGWPPPVLVLVAATAAVLATPSYPALAAATPQCVPDEQLPAANALVTGVENVTWIAGPGVLGLILLSGQGPLVATALAGLLFCAAAWMASQVGLPRPAPVAEPGSSMAEMLDGIRVVATRPKVRRPMTVAVIDNFLYGYLVVAMVVLAEQLLGGEAAIGWLNAGLSIGALGAMVVVNRLAGTRRPAFVLFTVMAIFTSCSALVGVSGWLPVTVALVAVAGAATLIAEVIAVTLLQRSAPENLVARVFGVYDQLNVGAIAVGSLIAGPLAEALGPQLAIVVVALCCLVASMAATSRLSERADRLGRHALQRLPLDPAR